MNQDQAMAMLRVILAAGGPVTLLLISFGVPADQANTVTNSILVIVSAAGPVISIVWGWIAHSNAGTVAATERLADRTDHTIAVAVTPNAPPEIKAIADDPTRPAVVAVNKLPEATSAGK